MIIFGLFGANTAAASFDFTTFWLIVIASVVAMIGRYIKIPYALALVITSLLVGPSHIYPLLYLPSSGPLEYLQNNCFPG